MREFESLSLRHFKNVESLDFIISRLFLFLLTCDDKQDMIKLGYNFVSVIIRKELYYEKNS